MAIGINLGNDADEDFGPLSHWNENLNYTYEPDLLSYKSDADNFNLHEPSMYKFRSGDENELIHAISRIRNAHNNTQHERKILENHIKEKKKRYIYRG